MDWPKARGWLIVAFLLLNGWLALQGAGPALGTRGLGGFTQAEWAEVEQRLNQAGIQVGISLPQEAPSLNLLRVSKQTSVDGIFRGATSIISGYNDTQLYTYPPAVDVVTGPARQVADNFLRDRSVDRKDGRYFGTYTAGEGQQVVEFIQVYNNLPIYNSRLRLVVTDHGVVEAQDLWLFLQGGVGQTRPTLSAHEGLLRLAGHLQRGASPLTRTLIGAELGYYAHPYPGSNQWDLVPVWRFVFDDETYYYVNAFTGGLEL